MILGLETNLALLIGEAFAAAFGFGAAFGFADGFALVGIKSSDASESSPASFFFFFMAALMAALPFGLPDLRACISSSKAS